MKNTTLAVFLLLNSVAQAQSVKDYLIPAGSNVSHFFRRLDADKAGRKIKMVFVKQGDAHQIILFDSVSMVKISAWMSNDEIKFLEMESLKFDSGSLPEIKKHDVNAQAQTYLKLPPASAGAAATWTISNHDGSKIKCSAVLLDLLIKGEKKKTLKVRKDFYLSGQLVIQASVFEYYVPQVGLWKIETETGQIKQELIKQEYDKSIEHLGY